MTSRERMLKAFEFAGPDRMPVVYHPSPAGLYTHGEKLLELFRKYPPDNPPEFNGIPTPPATAFINGIYCDTRRDEWGTVWEYNIFGIQGHAKQCPLADLARLDSYQFPPAPDVKSPEALRDRETIAREKENYLVFRGGLSLFEKLLALRPMSDMLMDIYTQDERFLNLLDRLTEYMKRVAQYLVFIGADVIMFGDDWGHQAGPFIPLAMFRKIFRWRYEALFDIIRKAGRRIFFHSCGALGPIFDELADMGIHGIWHQVNRYDENASAEKCRAKKITAYLHPDRQRLIPLGTPQEIRAQIKRYADIYHQLNGGGIFYIEIENDAPFENVKALIEAVQKYR